MSDEYPKDPLVLAATRALNLGHARPDIQANLMTRMHCNELALYLHYIIYLS